MKYFFCSRTYSRAPKKDVLDGIALELLKASLEYQSRKQLTRRYHGSYDKRLSMQYPSGAFSRRRTNMQLLLKPNLFRPSGTLY